MKNPIFYKTITGTIEKEYSFYKTLFYEDIIISKNVYCRCCFSPIKSNKAFRLGIWWDSDGNGHSEWNKRKWYCKQCFNVLNKNNRFCKSKKRN